MKFLIDECLTPDLAKAARRRGFGDSTHVSWLGLAGTKDWRLLPLILDGDWSFVTKNSDDFRGPTDRPGSKGLYAGVAIHAGLVASTGRKVWIVIVRKCCLRWRSTKSDMAT